MLKYYKSTINENRILREPLILKAGAEIVIVFKILKSVLKVEIQFKFYMNLR